jgi:branched-chain amino acid transport system permease protein
VIYSNWDTMTRGTASLVGLPLSINAWGAYACAVASLIAAFAFQSTRTALTLRASREDEPAARSIGINVGRVRLWAFVLSAAIVGLGGVLQGHFLGTLSVDQFYVNISFLTLQCWWLAESGRLPAQLSVPPLFLWSRSCYG